MRSDELKKIIALADYITTAEETVASWTIEFGLLGYALYKLDEYVKEDRYYMFLKSFCDVYSKEPPVLSSVQHAFPIVLVNEMQKKVKSKEYENLTKTICTYLKETPRQNLLPFKLKGIFTAYHIESIVSDLLVRVLCDNLKKEDADKEIKRYIELFMDKKDNLFYHVCLPDLKFRLPNGRNYSGRDNVLTLFALTLIAEKYEFKEESINTLISTVTAAILKYKNTNGSYNGFLRNKKKSIIAGYLEGKKEEDEGLEDLNISKDPSIAAYFSFCCIINAKNGIIDKGYMDTAKEAFFSALNSLQNQDGAIYMPDVLKKNFIFNIVPRYLLKHKATTKNSLYGIAGLILNGVALFQEEENEQ